MQSRSSLRWHPFVRFTFPLAGPSLMPPAFTHVQFCPLYNTRVPFHCQYPSSGRAGRDLQFVATFQWVGGMPLSLTHSSIAINSKKTLVKPSYWRHRLRLLILRLHDDQEKYILDQRTTDVPPTNNGTVLTNGKRRIRSRLPREVRPMLYLHEYIQYLHSDLSSAKGYSL
jgi:hypothetical protein